VEFGIGNAEGGSLNVEGGMRNLERGIGKVERGRRKGEWLLTAGFSMLITGHWRFKVSGFSPAAGLKNGQFNRKRNEGIKNPKYKHHLILKLSQINSRF